MDEQVWFMQQRSRVLQEFRSSISLMWDDEAARDLSRSYLNPHEEDDTSMVNGFVNQNHHLGETERARVEVLDLAQNVVDVLREIEELIERVDEDSHRSVQYLRQYRSVYAEAKSMLPEIDQVIGSAHTAGDSAAYDPD